MPGAMENDADGAIPPTEAQPFMALMSQQVQVMQQMLQLAMQQSSAATAATTWQQRTPGLLGLFMRAGRGGATPYYPHGWATWPRPPTSQKTANYFGVGGPLPYLDELFLSPRGEQFQP